MTIDDCIRDVVGYEGKYKINIFGEVFNKKGRQLKPCVDKFGYLKCCLYDGKPHQKKIHRMVAEAFIPNLLCKEQVNHIDGNKENNCVWKAYIYNLGRENGYNKALNDFINICEKQFTTMYGQRYVDMRDIVNIAEQLKAGGENESK